MQDSLPYGTPFSLRDREAYLNAPVLGHYEKLFASLHRELIPYYRSWTHDCPMVVSLERDDELSKLCKILYKCCVYYVHHYKEYLDRIPLDERVLEILSYTEGKEFHAGTYRPDFLICRDGRLLLCEITSRFFGNGYFLSYFTEHAARVFAKEADITCCRSYFESFLSYMADMPQGKRKLTVLKSSDKSDSIKLYVPFYHALGMKTEIIEAEDVETCLSHIKDSFVVSALNQKDLLSFSRDTLKALADADMRNDFRTIFLLHDKRFFALFADDTFTSECLTPGETVFLREHTVPTFLPGFSAAVWEDARIHKDRYILKHHWLGKSEKVYAGCLTDPETWESLFRHGDVSQMILQPFMQQRIFETVWNHAPLRDYVCGTLLTVDDRYFGPGLFRSSTRPVINQADAHKVAGLITGESSAFPKFYLL